MLEVYTPSGWLEVSVINLCIVYDYEGYQNMSFDLMTNDKTYTHFREETKLRYKDNYFVVKKINQRSIYTTIEAELDLDEWKVGFHRSFVTNEKLFSEVVLMICLDGWTIENTGIITERADLNLEGVTNYDILMQCKNVYNLTYEFHTADKRIKVIKPDVVQSRGLYVTDELNLRELSFKGDSSNIATRLYAFGKKTEEKNEAGEVISESYVNFADINGGKTYVENHQFSDKIISVYWHDDSYTDPEQLKRAAIEQLNELAVPQRSYDCKLTDLSRINPKYRMLDFKLYDKVTLMDSIHNTCVQHQVVEFTEYPNNPSLNDIVLSSSFKKITGTIDGLKTTVSSLDSDRKVTENSLNELKRDVLSNTFRIQNTYTKGDIEKIKSSILQQADDSINASVTAIESRVDEVQLRPDISIIANLPIQQVYSPSNDLYIPDYTQQMLTLTPLIKVMGKEQTVDNQLISWSKKEGEFSEGEFIDGQVLKINKNILSTEHVVSYVVTYQYEEEKNVMSEISLSMVSDGTNGTAGKNAAVCHILANQSFFASSDGINYSPQQIVLTPEFQECGFNLWKYSSDGLTWSNVVSGQNGLTISTSNQLIINSSTNLLADVKKALNIKLLSTQSGVASAITILKLKDGQKGDNGVGIVNAVAEYALSASNAEAPSSGWNTVAPEWTEGQYYWQRIVTSLSDGTSKISTPVCITGAKGNTGQGINSIITEFYLSSSKETQTDGVWQATMPTWEIGKYVWTRSKITYKNPTSVVYTEPVCDTGWEAANDTASDLNAKITSVTGTVADLKTTTDSIRAIVEETKETTTQTYADLTKLIESYNSFVEQTSESISGGVVKSKEYTDGQLTELKKLAKYFDFDTRGLMISGYDSEDSEAQRVKSLMSNDRFAILFDNTEVMQIFKNLMKIANISLSNSLTLNPWEVTNYGSTDSGGWVFKWKGWD